ncbi:conserved hypothetical protein [Sporisorium reilianum SRZ2]|uniref:Uncharacterized protein n=2 Tax=Sporisorium reilianum TaxID=72558 RepID=E6ZM06_SPORE|nr:conserved hypothetical protein [Sporisorium reilianum SRZ2]SJX63892.1 uncharacterized protein SRS1_14595 [Sporisorium reilianum f. sp. reilianum]
MSFPTSYNKTLSDYSHLKKKVIYRCGQRLDPSIATPGEVTHRFCAGSVFARVLERNLFQKSSNASLRLLKRLRRSDDRTKNSQNFVEYEWTYHAILDTFCLLDYQVMPLPADPLSHFKLVNRLGKENLPRPPLPILIASLRFDISTLSELLRRDICTLLAPENVLNQTADCLKQRFRVIRAVQNLYAEHCIMLAPHDDAFFWRDCKVCARYDPEIIRFCRDLYHLLLRIFHGERNRPISCRFFTPFPEMSDADSCDEAMA